MVTALDMEDLVAVIAREDHCLNSTKAIHSHKLSALTFFTPYFSKRYSA